MANTYENIRALSREITAREDEHPELAPIFALVRALGGQAEQSLNRAHAANNQLGESRFEQKKLKEKTEFWQAKYHGLRLENNALRKANAKLRKAANMEQPNANS